MEADSRAGRGRLEELVARWRLDPAAAGRLARLVDLLAGDPLAPTSVAGHEATVDVHVADSLTALQVPEVRAARRIADLGSGAGLPGLVVAAVLPGTSVDLVESSRRKCAFIDGAIAHLGVANARVFPERIEERATCERGAYDAVLARAVAPLPVLVEYAAPLLGRAGVLVAWKGRRDLQEEHRGARAAALLGMGPAHVEAVTPYPGSRDRHLHVFRRTGPCPPEYPRRSGMARKRPVA